MEVEWNMEWLDPTVPSSGVQNYVLNMQCIIWVAQLIAQYFIIGQSKAINETRITMHNIHRHHSTASFASSRSFPLNDVELQARSSGNVLRFFSRYFSNAMIRSSKVHLAVTMYYVRVYICICICGMYMHYAVCNIKYGYKY